jgi:hypothetical protein
VPLAAPVPPAPLLVEPAAPTPLVAPVLSPTPLLEPVEDVVPEPPAGPVPLVLLHATANASSVQGTIRRQAE